jgi:hypothetical protein
MRFWGIDLLATRLFFGPVFVVIFFGSACTPAQNHKDAGPTSCLEVCADHPNGHYCRIDSENLCIAYPGEVTSELPNGGDEFWGDACGSKCVAQGGVFTTCPCTGVELTGICGPDVEDVYTPVYFIYDGYLDDDGKTASNVWLQDQCENQGRWHTDFPGWSVYSPPLDGGP